MTVLAVVATASAAPWSGQTVAWVDSGYVLDQPAIAFGVGHLWAPEFLRLGVQASAGARATLIEENPQDPPFGLATVTLGVSSRRVGFVALFDTAILPAAEEDCNPFGEDCRMLLTLESGGGRRAEHKLAGVDSMQCVVGALFLLPTLLRGFPGAGRYTWLGGDDLGFVQRAAGAAEQ